ncbi:hypothetical protein [Amycolatopsis kentuckyensis]|uniref:hypothetical protein n=1 Tax=Amycolatopsis kentuckyensis TaxID=218823 RepID=UPI0035648DF2
MAGPSMIAAQLACTQKLENGGEDDRRFVALVFTIAHPEGAEDPTYAEIPAASLTITVKGEVADLFEIGTVYDFGITEEAE